jgi:PhnB protein
VTNQRRLIAPTTITEEVLMPDVKAIPDGYPRLTPYLAIDGAGEAIEFYSKVLGAKERMRMPNPDGGVGHAELELGDSLIMLADASEEMGFRSPRSLGASPVTLHLYVEDVDSVFERALAQGATEVRAIENQFYGDRSGQFEDPFGHRWNIATHVEDVAPDEMEKRVSEMVSARD